MRGLLAAGSMTTGSKSTLILKRTLHKGTAINNHYLCKYVSVWNWYLIVLYNYNIFYWVSLLMFVFVSCIVSCMQHFMGECLCTYHNYYHIKMFQQSIVICLPLHVSEIKLDIIFLCCNCNNDIYLICF